jgi:hypothetical protein
MGAERRTPIRPGGGLDAVQADAVIGAPGRCGLQLRNAGFIRQMCNRRVLLPDKSGVPMVVPRYTWNAGNLLLCQTVA